MASKTRQQNPERRNFAPGMAAARAGIRQIKIP